MLDINLPPSLPPSFQHTINLGYLRREHILSPKVDLYLEFAEVQSLPNASPLHHRHGSAMGRYSWHTSQEMAFPKVHLRPWLLHFRIFRNGSNITAHLKKLSCCLPRSGLLLSKQFSWSLLSVTCL